MSVHGGTIVYQGRQAWAGLLGQRRQNLHVVKDPFCVSSFGFEGVSKTDIQR